MGQGSGGLVLAAVLGLAVGALDAAESETPGADPDKALLEIEEATSFLASPDDGAKAIDQLEVGTKLVLLTHKKHGAYWRVIRLGRGPNGWVHSGRVKFLRDKEDKEEEDEGEQCADSLDRCPAEGCGGDDAASNVRKRRLPNRQRRPPNRLRPRRSPAGTSLPVPAARRCAVRRKDRWPWCPRDRTARTCPRRPTGRGRRRTRCPAARRTRAHRRTGPTCRARPGVRGTSRCRAQCRSP